MHEQHLLKLVGSWRRAIVADLITHNPNLASAQQQHITRQLILAIVWLFLCEQRGIVAKPSLQTLETSFAKPSYQSSSEPDRSLYIQLLEALQTVSVQLGQPLPQLLHLPTHLTLSNAPLAEIIHNLYAFHSAPSSQLSSTGLAQIYEHSLSWTIDPQVANPKRNTKKAGGIYYTPPAIVDYMIEATIGSRLSNSLTLGLLTLDSLTILDPACGSGAFLVRAYQVLLNWYLHQYLHRYLTASAQVARHQTSFKDDRHAVIQHHNGQWQLTQAERERILVTHLYGVDIDPHAVDITKLCLWLTLLEDVPDLVGRSLPNLDHTIRCGNALIGTDYPFDPCNHSSHAHDALKPFDWHHAFPNILNQGGFDVVIGNPPYLDSEGMTLHVPTWRSYCNQRYRTATGNWDLFCIFIEKAIELCRPGGFTSLIVPNKLASANYAAPARQLLSQDTQLLTIRDYSHVPVFAASVYPLVYVAQNIPPHPKATVQYELMQNLHQVKQTRSLPLHTAPPDHPWLLRTTPHQFNVLTRLQRDFPPLEQVAHVTGAATVSEAYALQALICDRPTPEPEDLRVVNSGTIDRYHILWGKKPLRYLGQSYLYPVIPLTQCSQLSQTRQQQATQPKLIIAGMTQRLECLLDGTGTILAGKSTSVIRVRRSSHPAFENLDLRYLLGVLNSHLLSVYFCHRFNGNRLQGGYFRVGPPQLRQLPICLPNLNHPRERQTYDQLIDLVEQMLAVHRSPPALFDPSTAIQQQILTLDQQIDRLVCNLYNITEAERDAVLSSFP